MTYSKDDFRKDCEYLREHWQSEEVEEFVYDILKQGFKMTRKEFTELSEDINEVI